MNSKNKSSDLWEKIEPNENLVNNAIQLANRDLKTAENIFNDGDYDWSFAISYNAMLQAGRALMFKEGFRPKGQYKHVSVVEFGKPIKYMAVPPEEVVERVKKNMRTDAETKVKRLDDSKKKRN